MFMHITSVSVRQQKNDKFITMMILDIYRLFIYSQLHPVQGGPGAVVVQPGVALLVHRHAAVSAHVRLTKNICTA